MYENIYDSDPYWERRELEEIDAMEDEQTLGDTRVDGTAEAEEDPQAEEAAKDPGEEGPQAEETERDPFAGVDAQRYAQMLRYAQRHGIAEGDPAWGLVELAVDTEEAAREAAAAANSAAHAARGAERSVHECLRAQRALTETMQSMTRDTIPRRLDAEMQRAAASLGQALEAAADGVTRRIARTIIRTMDEHAVRASERIVRLVVPQILAPAQETIRKYVTYGALALLAITLLGSLAAVAWPIRIAFF